MNEPGSVSRRRIARRIGVVIAAYLCYVGAIWVLAGRPPAAVASVGGMGAHGDPVAGRRVWLASGCGACHSLVGLGGHVGPDLTDYGRSENIANVRSTVRLGRLTMPSFELSDRDIDDLVAYLRTISRSAHYPPNSLRDPEFGDAP